MSVLARKKRTKNSWPSQSSQQCLRKPDVLALEGEYLPLEVYTTRGFDTSRIEKLCEDKKPSAMFGTVYRVDIEYQSKGTKEKRIKDAILESVQERKGAGGRGGFGAGQSVVVKGGGRGGGASVGAGAQPSQKRKEPGDPTLATKK